VSHTGSLVWTLCTVGLIAAACGSSTGGGGGGGLPLGSGADAHVGSDGVAASDALADAAPLCSNDCETEGQALCSSSTVAAVCQADQDGCLHIVATKTCAASQTCVDGACKKVTCVPACDGTTCGDNGCGGTCACGSGMTCQSGVCAAPSVCGNGKCEQGESPATCQQDCKPPASCGDGVCGGGETAVTCPADCKCSGKDSFCDPDGQSLHFCDSASGKLTQKGCAAVCADSGGMTFTKCDIKAADGIAYCFCKKCGDGTCSFGESYASCPSDCACTTADNSCTGATQASTCDASTGKLVTQNCSDSACAAANLGKSAGCGIGSTGTTSCLCKKLGCGDGVCEGNESKASCPADCVGCATNTDCGAGNVCQSTIQQCASADGATYKLTIKSGTAPSATASGGAWDIDGSLPDPYLNVYVNGSLVCYTAPVSNTTTPTWNATCNTALKLTSSDTLKFVMMDDDVGLDDQIADDIWTGADLVNMLANGGNSGAMIGTVGVGTATLTVKLVAQ
jgi:Cys-rich repeat protein